MISLIDSNDKNDVDVILKEINYITFILNSVSFGFELNQVRFQMNV